MRTFFQARGEEETAALFHSSSMEYVRSLGGDPLCLVTELPLFVVEASKGPPGVPQHYLDLRAELPELTQRLRHGEPISERLNAYGLRPLPVAAAVRLQRRALELGLAAVAAGPGLPTSSSDSRGKTNE